jgi:outer membrane protein assembly factor BamD (BamD/ComL family)
MNLNAKALKFIILSLLLVQSCSVQKSRNDVSKTGLFFHNLTAKYNGYFNAKTLLDEAELILSESYKDDYNKILELYEYNGVADASSQSANLDLAIKKGSTLVNLHRPSHWVPDTYLLIGQAQYFKQTYETAEETFKYMVNNYDKLHISTKKKTKEQANKERAIRVREQQEKREEEKAVKEKEKKKADKTKEQQQKDRKKANKQKQKEREQYLKDRKKAAKAGKPLPPRPSTTSKPAAKDSVKTSPIVNKKTDKAKPEQKEKEEEGESLAQTAQKKGKPSKNHRPVLQDAQLWLAKTYIMRKNGIAASIILSQLKSDPGLYEEIRPEIPVLQAYNHIKQEEYADAIPFLKEALETKGISNKKKARVAFVLGQLTALQKDAVSSYEAFNKVSDFHPSYDLQFFAKLYAAQQGVVSGKAKKEDLLNDLKKLTRDEKNIEFGTAIYHSMALVHLADGNREEAKATLIKGLSEKGDNTQKTESFYLMANMYYEDEDYLKAKNYFDSTLAVIGDKDIRKEEVSRYSQSLAEIARNLSIIQVQDSMLIVSTWPEKEQKQWARKIVKNRTAGLVMPKAGLLDQANAIQSGRNIPTSLPTSGSKSTFFAYDDKVLKKGIKDFEKLWGTIKLQDNWRLSQKHSNSLVSNVNPGDPTAAASKEEEVADAGEEVDRILAELPKTAEQKAMANEKIRNSMYTLGILYREKLENYTKSISILESTLTKYPASEIEQDILYQLYLASMQNKDAQRADKYKNRLINEYPGSKYTQAILHPGEFAALEDRDAKINKYYDETYSMFNNGQCETAMNRVQQVDSLFKENPLKAKFAMLGVLCTGKSQGKEAYLNALKDFIARYPQSDERDKAKDMLRYLMGDEKAFETADIIKTKENPNAYDYVADELHYVIAIIYDKKENTLSDLKISISDFNQKFFQNDDLKISNIFLDQDATIPIIMVRKFDNAAAGLRYFQTIKNNRNQFIKPEINHELFAISQSNYRKLHASKNVVGYKDFFEANYKE